jgi:hypothetical protein
MIRTRLGATLNLEGRATPAVSKHLAKLENRRTLFSRVTTALSNTAKRRSAIQQSQL